MHSLVKLINHCLSIAMVSSLFLPLSLYLQTWGKCLAALPACRFGETFSSCPVYKKPSSFGGSTTAPFLCSIATTANAAADISKSASSGPALWISDLNDIHANLAFEVRLTELEDLSHPCLFLWRNNKTVVIGRHQNPWTECNIEKMKKDGVKLARRFSGGGAVYQDLDNTCFTFLSPKESFSIKNNNEIILAALRKAYGIKGEISGRNDLTYEGKKFSGSAYKYMRNLSLHHGTILLNVKPTAFADYLTPNKLKLQSKGINSVASRIVNLRDVNPDIEHEGLTEAISKEFKSFYELNEKRINVFNLTFASPILEDSIYQKHLRELEDWDWCFGKTPKFSHKLEHRFPWATFEVYLFVVNGVIEEAKVYSDSLFPDLVEALNQSLIGIVYSPETVRNAVKGIEGREIHKAYVEEFSEWIATEISA